MPNTIFGWIILIPITIFFLAVIFNFVILGLFKLFITIFFKYPSAYRIKQYIDGNGQNFYYIQYKRLLWLTDMSDDSGPDVYNTGLIGHKILYTNLTQAENHLNRMMEYDKESMLSKKRIGDELTVVEKRFK